MESADNWERMGYHMKKIIAYVVVLVLLLAAFLLATRIPSGDKQPTQQETTSDPTQQETTSDPNRQEITEPTEDPTVPTEPELSADDCLLTERKTLTYEEFFGEDRVYAIDSSIGYGKWTLPSGDERMLFTTHWDWDRKEVYVSSYACEGRYYVPGTAAYRIGYSILEADGMYIYFRNNEEIVQLDMRTGKARQLVKCDYIGSAYICGKDALYYAAVTDGKLAINRLYIPTMRLDVLYDDFAVGTPYGEQELFLYMPESTQGDIVVRCINPEMREQINKEISNPNSKYNVPRQGLGVTELWNAEDPWTAALSHDRLWLCYFVQEDTGIRTFVEITCNLQNGTESRRLGIIDNCWFGSSVSHDHYNPEITKKDDPVPAIGQWIDIPNVTPIREEVTTIAYSDQFAPYTLYRYEDGRLKEKLTDIPVISAYGGLCVTEDNRLIQVSGDGSICNTLYKVKDRIREMDSLGDKLYFLDGDTMIELDLAEARYRTLLERTGIVEMYLDNSRDELDDAYAQIYFAVGEGLSVTGYQYNMETGEIIRTGYRL